MTLPQHKSSSPAGSPPTERAKIPQATTDDTKPAEPSNGEVLPPSLRGLKHLKPLPGPYFSSVAKEQTDGSRHDDEDNDDGDGEPHTAPKQYATATQWFSVDVSDLQVPTTSPPMRLVQPRSRRRILSHRDHTPPSQEDALEDLQLRLESAERKRTAHLQSTREKCQRHLQQAHHVCEAAKESEERWREQCAFRLLQKHRKATRKFVRAHKDKDEAAQHIQRWYRQHRLEKLKASIDNFEAFQTKSPSFEVVSANLQDPVLQENIRSILRILMPAEFPSVNKAADASPPRTRRLQQHKVYLAARELLASLLIVHHRDTIFTQETSLEENLFNTASSFLKELHRWCTPSSAAATDAATTTGNPLPAPNTHADAASSSPSSPSMSSCSSSALLVDDALVQSIKHHLKAFKAWKTKDLTKLASDMEAHYVELLSLRDSVDTHTRTKEEWHPHIDAQLGTIEKRLAAMGLTDTLAACLHLRQEKHKKEEEAQQALQQSLTSVTGIHLQRRVDNDQRGADDADSVCIPAHISSPEIPEPDGSEGLPHPNPTAMPPGASEGSQTQQQEEQQQRERMQQLDEQYARQMAASWDLQFLHNVCLDPSFRLQEDKDTLTRYHDDPTTHTSQERRGGHQGRDHHDYVASTTSLSEGEYSFDGLDGEFGAHASSMHASSSVGGKQGGLTRSQYKKLVRQIEHQTKRAFYDHVGEVFALATQSDPVPNATVVPPETENEEGSSPTEATAAATAPKGASKPLQRGKAPIVTADRLQSLGELLQIIKEKIKDLTLPRQESLRQSIDRGIDIPQLLAGIAHGTIVFENVKSLILYHVKMLAAPARDPAILLIADEDTTPGPFFFDTMQLLQAMQLDLANYVLMLFRPIIKRYGVEIERKRVQDLVFSGGISFTATKVWLQAAASSAREESKAYLVTRPHSPAKRAASPDGFPQPQVASQQQSAVPLRMQTGFTMGMSTSALVFEDGFGESTANAPTQHVLPFFSIFVSGIEQLMFSPKYRGAPESVWPESLVMDRSELVRIQNEIDVAARVAALYTLAANIVPSIKKDTQGFQQHFAEVMTEAFTTEGWHQRQVSAEDDQRMCTFVKLLAKQHFGPGVPSAQLEKIARLTLKDDHPVLRLLQKRIRDSFRRIFLSEDPLHLELRGNNGLDAVLPRLKELFLRLVRIFDHNRKVYAPVYDEFISAACPKEENGEKDMKDPSSNEGSEVEGDEDEDEDDDEDEAQKSP